MPGDPKFGKLFPCVCTAERQQAKLSRELSSLSQLDSLRHLTFESFDPSMRGTESAFRIAREYARATDGWLVLHGAVGVGKTHLAAAVANAYAARNAQAAVYFRVVPDLLDQLRATFDPENGVAYDERFQQIRNANLLVLDDLGTEHTTAWASEKLFQIINHRYNEQLPTVITSNARLDRIEDRIVSRMLDARLSRYVFVDADDYRVRGFTQSQELR
ncbi:MAG: ATP-binding protein [Thermomicrobiales bacterium]|nr:ATP-binding protein [Thermomicrobiales bacterium]